MSFMFLSFLQVNLLNFTFILLNEDLLLLYIIILSLMIKACTQHSTVQNKEQACLPIAIDDDFDDAYLLYIIFQ